MYTFTKWLLFSWVSLNKTYFVESVTDQNCAGTFLIGFCSLSYVYAFLKLNNRLLILTAYKSIFLLWCCIISIGFILLLTWLLDKTIDQYLFKKQNAIVITSLPHILCIIQVSVCTTLFNVCGKQRFSCQLLWNVYFLTSTVGSITFVLT